MSVSCAILLALFWRSCSTNKAAFFLLSFFVFSCSSGTDDLGRDVVVITKIRRNVQACINHTHTHARTHAHTHTHTHTHTKPLCRNQVQLSTVQQETFSTTYCTRMYIPVVVLLAELLLTASSSLTASVLSCGGSETTAASSP